MYIRVRDIMQLKILEGFDLLAGEGGLDRKIKKMCLLDHEIINPIEEQFFKDEFALSSLLGAKDDENLIIKSIKYLNENEVSGLAVKNIYYDKLPEKVIKYANDNDFPIIMIDNSVFFEDIITDVRDLLRDLEKGKNLEEQLDLILKEFDIEKDDNDLLYQIAGITNSPYQVLYITESKKQRKSQIITILESFRILNIETIKGLIKYHEGIVIIYSTKQFSEQLFNIDLSHILMEAEAYHIGVSQIFNNTQSFGQAFKQAVYSLKVAEIKNLDKVFYEDIGLYKLIIPFADNSVFIKYANNIVEPIIAYDKKYNSELLATGNVYVDNEGNIKKAAEKLFLHDNTVRYRINKIKEILHMESEGDFFYEQLSMALKIIKVKEIDFSND